LSATSANHSSLFDYAADYGCWPEAETSARFKTVFGMARGQERVFV